MPISVDLITHKKLILVKQLYQNAVVLSGSQHSTINRILSIIGFDLSIETSLRAAVGSLDSSRTPADGFQGLIQQVDNLCTQAGMNPIPDRANIQHIHSIRNDAQHKAKYPNESDINDCRTYTRDFLHKIFFEIWGVDFENISLVDIVQHDRVKRFLAEAETALEQKDYQLAVQHSAAGLTYALNRVQRAVVGYMPSFTNRFMMIDSFGREASESNGRDVYQAFKRIQDTVMYLSMGMNYSEYMKYKQISGFVIFTISGEPNFQGMKENIEPDEAEFVVAYCTESIEKIESLVGDINAPFGRERWY